MLNRDMKPYSLQYLKITDDEYGYPIEVWEELRVIDVAVNEIYKQTVDAEGVLYMRRTLQAVTRFKDFNRINKYRIVGANTYEVIDFINGRLTQLQLKEVI